MKVNGDLIVRTGKKNNKIWANFGIKDEKDGKFLNLFIDFSKKVIDDRPYNYMESIVKDEPLVLWFRGVDGFLSAYNGKIRLKLTGLEKVEKYKEEK